MLHVLKYHEISTKRICQIPLTYGALGVSTVHKHNFLRSKWLKYKSNIDYFFLKRETPPITFPTHWKPYVKVLKGLFKVFELYSTLGI